MATHSEQHKYFVPEPSAWPFLMTIAMFTFALGFASWLNGAETLGPYLFAAGLAFILVMTFVWFRGVIVPEPLALDFHPPPAERRHHRACAARMAHYWFQWWFGSIGHPLSSQPRITPILSFTLAALSWCVLHSARQLFRSQNSAGSPRWGMM